MHSHEPNYRTSCIRTEFIFRFIITQAERPHFTSLDGGVIRSSLRGPEDPKNSIASYFMFKNWGVDMNWQMHLRSLRAWLPGMAVTCGKWLITKSWVPEYGRRLWFGFLHRAVTAKKCKGMMRLCYVNFVHANYCLKFFKLGTSQIDHKFLIHSRLSLKFS